MSVWERDYGFCWSLCRYRSWDTEAGNCGELMNLCQQRDEVWPLNPGATPRERAYVQSDTLLSLTPKHHFLQISQLIEWVLKVTGQWTHTHTRSYWAVWEFAMSCTSTNEQLEALASLDRCQNYSSHYQHRCKCRHELDWFLAWFICSTRNIYTMPRSESQLSVPLWLSLCIVVCVGVLVDVLVCVLVGVCVLVCADMCVGWGACRLGYSKIYLVSFM